MNNLKFKILLLLSILTFGLQAQTVTVKIMSMNIKEGGMYADFNPEAFCEVIRTYNPDFVVFQELDNYTLRNGNIDMLSEMAVSLGMFPYFGKAISYSSGDVGVGILSRYPFYNAKTVTSYPSGASEQRACSWIDVMLPAKRSIRIGVTHLDVASDQVRVSNLAAFNKSIFENNSLPTILAGDFNATPVSETMSYAYLKWQDIGTGTAFTIPSADPTRRIDYVLGYPKSWSKINYEIVSYPSLSDHCFIVAELQYQ